MWISTLNERGEAKYYYRPDFGKGINNADESCSFGVRIRRKKRISHVCILRGQNWVVDFGTIVVVLVPSTT